MMRRNLPEIYRLALSLLVVTTLAGGFLFSGFLSGSFEKEASAQNRRRGRAARKVEKKFVPDLQSLGKLGKKVKGSEFFEFTYSVRDKKGKLKKHKGFVRLPEKMALYRDYRMPLTKLDAGAGLLVFGKPVERDVISKDGFTIRGKDMQIQNAHVILSGDAKSFEIDVKYRNRKLPNSRWCTGQVERSKGGLLMKYSNESYRVTMKKGSPVLVRRNMERKNLKKGMTIRILGMKASDRPDTGKKSDGKYDCFEAYRVVVIDKRYAKTVYPLMWSQ